MCKNNICILHITCMQKQPLYTSADVHNSYPIPSIGICSSLQQHLHSLIIIIHSGLVESSLLILLWKQISEEKNRTSTHDKCTYPTSIAHDVPYSLNTAHLPIHSLHVYQHRGQAAILGLQFVLYGWPSGEQSHYPEEMKFVHVYDEWLVFLHMVYGMIDFLSEKPVVRMCYNTIQYLVLC